MYQEANDVITGVIYLDYDYLVKVVSARFCNIPVIVGRYLGTV